MFKLSGSHGLSGHLENGEEDTANIRVNCQAEKSRKCWWIGKRIALFAQHLGIFGNTEGVQFDISLFILAFFDTVDPWQCMNGFLYCRYDLTQKDHINFASMFNRCWLGNHSLYIFMIMSLFMCILLVPTSQSESILLYLDWNKMKWYTYIWFIYV